MDTSREVTGEEWEEEVMTPEEAFKRLQEWVAQYSKELTGISAVDAVRQARGSL